MYKKEISRINYFAIILFLFLATSQGCDDSICSNFNTSIVKISFFDKQTGLEKETTFDSIMSYGSDSLLYAHDTLSVVSLPVNPQSDSTIFIFFTPGSSDTLLLSYQRDVSLTSPSCGYSEMFDNIQVPYSTFSKVVLKSKTLSIANASDIEVFN